MATCPRCHEFLDDEHVCRGVGVRTARSALVVATAAAIGLIGGGLGFGLLGDVMNMPELETVGLVAGPIAAVIVARAFRTF